MRRRELFNVSPVHRPQALAPLAGSAAADERRSLACLDDRSSRPHAPRGCWPPRAGAHLRGPASHRLGAAADRRRGRPSALDRPPHPPRHGISRPPAPGARGSRYEWPCPGNLLHIDTKRYERFTRPGHAVTGDRHRTRREGSGSATSSRTRSSTTTRAWPTRSSRRRASTHRHRLPRAGARVPRARGIEPAADQRQRMRLRRKSSPLPGASRRPGDPSPADRPHRPQTNGKVERDQQTLAREWAYGLTYRTSADRAGPCHTGSATTTSNDPTQDWGPAADQPCSRRVGSGQLAPSRPSPRCRDSTASAPDLVVRIDNRLGRATG